MGTSEGGVAEVEPTFLKESIEQVAGANTPQAMLAARVNVSKSGVQERYVTSSHTSPYYPIDDFNAPYVSLRFSLIFLPLFWMLFFGAAHWLVFLLFGLLIPCICKNL